MEALSSSPNNLLLLFFFTSLFAFSAASTTSTTAKKPPRLVSNLIHYDSVHSPYYNPKATVSNRAKRALKTSLARLAYLQAKITITSPLSSLFSGGVATDDYRAGVTPNDGGALFMANISIGEPPVSQIVTVDTGSSLFWIQCLPCTKCFQQYPPIFDPSKSSTYANLSCDSPSCVVNPLNDKCDQFNICKYEHPAGITSTGNLASEKLTFETSDKGLATVDGVVFGCGHDNDGFDGQPSGILGLGPDSNISLVTKLGSKFSYCLGRINDLHYSYNNLIIGEGAIIQGPSSPLDIFNNRYYLTLEGISVGQKRLDIDPEFFRRKSTGEGGVIIDSSSTVSFLVKGAFDPLSEEVENLLDGVLERVDDPDHPSRLCYKGIISKDLKGFPTVSFYFAGGAELALDIGSFFQENGPSEFCMAVMESDLTVDLNVIGVIAQQSYKVAYDLVGKTISFERVDCQLLKH